MEATLKIREIVINVLSITMLGNIALASLSICIPVRSSVWFPYSPGAQKCSSTSSDTAYSADSSSRIAMVKAQLGGM